MRLLTIPHTGTHFADWVLRDRWGVKYSHHHLRDWRYGVVLAESGESCVVTLRDPIRQRISCLNRREKVPVELFGLLPGLLALRNVWFFRVDCPAAHRRMELLGLAVFVGYGGDDFELDWAPRNVSEDVTGLGARYSAGEVPAELGADAEWLRSHGLVEFYGAMGYRLPWMGVEDGEGVEAAACSGE